MGSDEFSLPNTCLFGRERQDFDALAFSQFLQANRHSVLELNGISIGCCVCRQLAEGYRFAGAETVSLLERGRDSAEHEFSPVRNANRTFLGFGSKHSSENPIQPLCRFGWFK